MASAMVADFARMPTQRKVLVFAVIGTLVGLLYWKFAYKALDEDLDAAQGEHDDKVALNRRLAADIPAYEELRTHLTLLKELIEKNQTALPSAPELPALFETLQHKVAESGVEIRKWTNRPEEPVESFIKVPVEIEITGTFMQIKRFFASLVPKKKRAGMSDVTASGDPAVEERERIVSIDNLTIGDPQVKNREIILTAKFTANTFRQEEKLDLTPAKPAGAAATPTPPPAGAGSAAAKPLPPAATPQGAKVRANNAMDKSEQRTGSADQRLKGGL
jgi:Tfp pilus assembly protein PilO